MTASDGDEAINQFRRHVDAIDCVLLDIDLPKRNGRACFKIMKEDAPNIPALFMSGLTTEVEKDEMLLRKPFGRTELINKLIDTLDRHGQHAGNRAVT